MRESQPYQHLINALREAPTNFSEDPKEAEVFQIFGPGGVSWSELAEIIESLNDRVAEAENYDSDPRYEYSYSTKPHMERGQGSVAAGQFWFETKERAERELKGDSTFVEKTFLTARSRAGEAFPIDRKDML